MRTPVNTGVKPYLVNYLLYIIYKYIYRAPSVINVLC